MSDDEKAGMYVVARPAEGDGGGFHVHRDIGVTLYPTEKAARAAIEVINELDITNQNGERFDFGDRKIFRIVPLVIEQLS